MVQCTPNSFPAAEPNLSWADVLLVKRLNQFPTVVATCVANFSRQRTQNVEFDHFRHDTLHHLPPGQVLTLLAVKSVFVERRT